MPTLRILMAEDNLVNQKVAQRMLARLGYEADIAPNGALALEAVHEHAYDVVLMDMQMPVMDGLEATRRIRAELPAERQPRIIAMTANAMQGDRERCLDAGMDEYLTKPVKLELLREALSEAAVARAALAPPQASPAPSSAPSSASSVDPEHVTTLLAHLEDLAGEPDPDFADELLESYEASAPNLIADIETGASGGDAALVQRAAHTLKSSAALFGSDALAEVCGRIESDAAAGTSDVSSDRLDALKARHAALASLVAAARARLRRDG